MKYRSQYLTDARGSVGGTTASKNHYGNFMRKRTKPVNPQTLSQVEVRAIFTSPAKNWKSLTDFQRLGWKQLATQISFTDSIGESFTLTGEALYIKNNCNLAKVGAPAILNAPSISANNVPYVVDFAADCIVTPGSEDVSISFSVPIAANLKMYIESSGVVSAGIEYMRNYRFIKVADNTFVTGASIKNEMLAKFGAIPAAGEAAFFRVHLVDTDSGFTGAKIADRCIGTI